jgi:hypothetical protein
MSNGVSLAKCVSMVLGCPEVSNANLDLVHRVARHSRAGLKASLAALLFAAALLLCAPLSQAQTAATGAITGTVTDPSGGAVANATVTATNKGTNQERDAKTAADGVYKFSFLTPGDYRLKFTAPGFKSSEVESVTVNVTETASVNEALQVGSVSERVTVESTVETLQTESSTLGTTVTGGQISALPMANGNYTEILSLSAGATSSVDNATSLGKGTQDISANGVDAGSNNFQMDGVSVNNIANSGTANDATIYAGIPIPSPDAIGEFKIQTSTYDASYGRNPGANVTVSTKSGTNDFHGSAFEFFRNTVLNANDFFLKQAQAASDLNKRAPLDQNQFGGTIGGPVKKDKLFFFFSYRGTRAKNGVAAQGQTFGAILPTELNPYAALGSRGTCSAPIAVPDNTVNSLISKECDATAQAFAEAVGIPDANVVGLRMFQLTTGTTKNPTAGGVPNNYYIPAPSSTPQCVAETGVCNFDVPAIYHENQYVANGDWVINNKHTLTTKYFYTANPQTLFLGQGGGDLPGSPENTPWGNQAAVAKVTSTLTSTFINEVRLSYQRNDEIGTSAMPPGGCPSDSSGNCGLAPQLGMLQVPPGFEEPPTMIDILDNLTMFGGLLPFKGPTNQIQGADQISWLHGSHSIRAGFEYEWTNWPLVDVGLQQGLLLTAGLLNAPPGLSPGVGTGGFAGPAWNVGLIFTLKGETGQAGITHFYQLNNQSAYVLDDWKVTPRLTLNIGLRWEYHGLLSDKYGRLTQVWLENMASNQDILSCCTGFTSDPAAIQQFVVPSNFAKHFGPPPTGVGTAPNIHTITGHAPYSNFAPRLGFAWQPLHNGKLVVRGGAGIFYNTLGLDFLVHAYETGSPYAATYDYAAGSSRWLQSTIASPYPLISLVCMPKDPNCNTDFGEGFPARFANPSNSPFAAADSTLSAEFNPNSVHNPLVQEYSLGTQYQFAPGWVLDVGYVGSTGINLNDYNHNHNQPMTLYSPGNDPYGLCQVVSGQTICNTISNAEFRVPYLGYGVFGLQGNDHTGRSNYNSLQVTVRHQFGHGLTMQAAYTWDKNLSDVFFASTSNVNEALCMKCQYGRVSFDRPQRFVVNYSYDLPFGKGVQGITGKLIGGWNVSGITIVQSGDALTAIDGNGGAAFGSNSTSAVDAVTTAQYCPGFGPGNARSPGGTKANLTNYFNPAAFCPTPVVPFGDPGPAALGLAPNSLTEFLDGLGSAATGFGNSGIGQVSGPSQFNWDFTIMKNTRITERIHTQFRADFYNAFNHPQFADPGGTSFANAGFVNVGAVLAAGPGVTTAASIVHTNVNPRLIQFGLRFMF